jgi:hypothetical protein
MFPHPSKLSGPVKHSTPDPDTLILTCDRRLRWPLLFGLSGLSVLLLGIWAPAVLVYFGLYCVASIIGAFYFAVLRADVVLSRKSATLELRPQFSWLPGCRPLLLPFSAIREFLVESEFSLLLDENTAFVWHLTAVTVDGKSHRLTWHFAHDPVFLAGQEAARIADKPLREEKDPWKSSTWSHWGYNFLK